MFARFWNFIRGVFRKVIPYKDIESTEKVETPVSVDMINALDRWYNLYINKAPWVLSKETDVKSLNLPAFIASEIARQIILEMKWTITGVAEEEGAEPLKSPRAEYLAKEFERCIVALRQKLEQGCAAGGMTVKPYPKDGHIYFDWTMDWSLYPISFDDDGNLADVIFQDTFADGKIFYTRLERHVQMGDNVQITQRAFKSSARDVLGIEIPLTEVPQWENLEPEVTVQNTGGQMFGWFKVACANNVDVDSPLGASVYCKAEDTIREADFQYTRILWEFEGSELAIDVDPLALRPKKNADGLELPKLNQRLFRAVDIQTGDGKDLYNVFAPPIRDVSLMNGMNQLLMRIEDQCGLSRGTLSDANEEAKTATELRIQKQRSYATIADNQTALERCLKDVIRAMDVYASLYNLAPDGDYEVSFEWDDSIITDSAQQMEERMKLLDSGIISKAEFREWYFGETTEQAAAAVQAIENEKAEAQKLSIQKFLPKNPMGGPTE